MTKEQVIQGYFMNSPKVVAEMLYDTIEKYENRSCDNCKNASFEIKFGELEFNACFLVSNGNVCKWQSK